MAQDNRLVQEFEEGSTYTWDGDGGSGPVMGGEDGLSSSGVYGGQVMPYRASPNGGLLDGLAPFSGLATPGEPDNWNKQPINRVCVFENEIHSIGMSQWHRQDKTTGAWVLVLDLAQYNAHAAHVNIGLYPVFNQATNKSSLVTAYFTDISLGQRYVALSYNRDDDVVTSGLPSATLQNSDAESCPQDCQLGNNIYFLGTDAGNIFMTLNGLNLSITDTWLLDTPSFFDAARPMDICAYSGSVYVVHKDTDFEGGTSPVGGSGVITITKMAPFKRIVLRLPFEDLSASHPGNPELGYAMGLTAANNPREKCVLFVDNNPLTSSGDFPSMWLYYQNSPQKTPIGLVDEVFPTIKGYGVYGYSVWELKGDGLGGLSVVRQKDTLMNQYRAGLGEGFQGSPSNLYQTDKMRNAVISYCDNYPGWFVTNPEKSFFVGRPFGGIAGQTRKQWDFEPDGAIPDFGDADVFGGPAKTTFVQDKVGGGSRWSPAAVSTTTALDVNIFDIVYTSGHMHIPTPTFPDTETVWRIHFKLMPSTAYHAGYSGVAGAGMSVRWYYDQFHSPNKRCTLTNGIQAANSSHGTATNNQVNGLTINSGVDYWVDWHFREDNLKRADRVYLCGLLFDGNNSDIPPLGL